MPADRISAKLWVFHSILGKHFLSLEYIGKSADCYASQSSMYETNQASRRITARIRRGENALKMALKDTELSKFQN